MRYTDINCEKCGEIFTENDDVVVCPVCGAPHHRNCWAENNACVHADEHDNGYQWQMPEQPKQEQNAETPGSVPANGFTLKNGENVIVCPRCGSLNCENDVYCMRCGLPFKGTPGAAEGQSSPEADGEQPDAQQPHTRNNERIYADFNRFGGLDPNAELGGIPVGEYSDYIGGSSPGKIIRKIAVMERFGKNIQICWPALFIGPVWFFWRKMKKEGFLFSAVLLAVCILSGLLQLNAPTEKYFKDYFALFSQAAAGEISAEEWKERFAEAANIYAYSDLTPEEEKKAAVATILSYIAEPGIPFVCALSAVYLYRKKIRSSVMDIRQRCTNMEEYRATLQIEGGTSVGLAVLGGILYAAAYLSMTCLPMFIVLF